VQSEHGGSKASPGRNFGFELNLANTWAFTKGYHEGFYSDGLAGTASGLASGIQAGLGAVGSYISYAGTYWFWGEEAATQTEVGQAIDGLTVGAMTYGPEVARILGELQSGNYSPETVAAIQTAEALTKSVLNSIADELASKPEAERAHLAGRIAGAIQFEIVLAFATGGGALALSAATKAGKFANIAKKLEGFFSPQTVQRIMSALETALNKPVKANAPNRVAGLLDEAAETALLRGQAEEMAQMLARTQSNARRGPVLSLVRDRVTGEVFDAQNLSSIPSNLHPLLASRLESHLAANAGKLNPVWGVPGAHSEVWALNQALLRRESLGIGVQSLDDFSLYNVSLWRNRLGTTVPRCGNCNPITDGVRVLSGN
jgi:hypothetical protein